MKSEPHVMEKVATSADTAALKSTLKVDWLRWPTEQAQPPTEDPYADPSSLDAVPLLTSAALPAALSAHRTVFLELSPPWCTTCMGARRLFVEVARRFAGGEAAGRVGAWPQPLFARGDTADDRALAEMFNVTCRNGVMNSGPDDPCGYVAVREGAAPVFVREGHTAGDVFRALIGFVGAVLCDCGALCVCGSLRGAVGRCGTRVNHDCVRWQVSPCEHFAPQQTWTRSGPWTR